MRVETKASGFGSRYRAAFIWPLPSLECPVSTLFTSPCTHSSTSCSKLPRGTSSAVLTGMCTVVGFEGSSWTCFTHSRLRSAAAALKPYLVAPPPRCCQQAKPNTWRSNHVLERNAQGVSLLQGCVLISRSLGLIGTWHDDGEHGRHCPGSDPTQPARNSPTTQAGQLSHSFEAASRGLKVLLSHTLHSPGTIMNRRQSFKTL
eukprot:61269-Rhodomonas_salina.6